MTANHPFTADLRRRHSHGLVWVIDLDPDDPVSGAGTAKLAIDGSTVFADYEQPQRLVRIEVPFGEINDDRDGQLDAMNRGGGFSALHEDWIRELLGGEVAAMLAESKAPVVVGVAKETSLWSPTGQLALLDTFLIETGMPCEGLWALEWLRLAGEAQLTPIVADRATTSIAEAALPLLRALPMEWLDSLDPRAFTAIRQGLRQAARACGEVRDTAVWNLLGDRELKSLEAQICEAFDPVLLDWSTQSPTPRREVEDLSAASYLGFEDESEGQLDADRTSIRTMIDASSTEAIVVANAESRANTVRVSVVPRHGFSDLIEFIDVRVLSERGLLAAATSLAFDTESENYQAVLTLPRLDDDEDVVVVLGLDLPLLDVGERWYVDTQRQLLHRRLRDALRTGDQDAADGYFRKLEITDRPDSAYSGPFTPELITSQNRNELHSHIESHAGHEIALRHLSFIRGEYVAAARNHLRFIDNGGENDLSERQLLLLARELGNQGDTESSRRILELLDH